jgi:tetratricopeptide (TPR) repeat protein
MAIGVDTRQLPRFVVRVEGEDGRILGTGFFVAAGWVLTCAHVVEDAPQVVVVPAPEVSGPQPAHVAARSTPPTSSRAGLWPFPDQALLHLPEIGEHPCAMLQAADPISSVRSYAWGYARREHGIDPVGSPANFHFGGVEGDGYFRLVDGQAKPGLSGAPLICPGRGAVIGIIVASEDPQSALGGWASPVSALLLGGEGVPGELAALGKQIGLGNQAALRASPVDWANVLRVDQPRLAGPEWEAQLRESGVYLWTAEDIRAGFLVSEKSDQSSSFEAGAAVDVVLLRGDGIPDLQRDFAVLGSAFDQWLGESHRKRADYGLRLLWLVGDPGPHRSKGLLACLARAGMMGRNVYDAGREVQLVARIIAGSAKNLMTSPAVIGLDIEAGQSAAAWDEVRNTVISVRKQAAAQLNTYPLLVVAGTAGQEQDAYEALKELSEIKPVDTRGRLHQRPYSDAGTREMVSPSLSREHVFNRGLPMTSRILFGRTDELEALRQAWQSSQTRIISIVAHGGTGKSALVNTWIREMRDHDYLGARRVLAWSFYSQGTKDNLVSADLFVNFALSWLDEASSVASLSAWAKGQKLAALIKEHKSLLVLDGLEPLQHPLTAPDVGGQLTDDSIRGLLEGLAESDWDGLCVITTRVPLADLKRFEVGAEDSTNTAVVWELENLDDQAGAALLKHLIGKDPGFRQLQQAVRDVGGHALAITLLGNYLRDVHQGDLAGRFDLEELTVEISGGGHARRIMASYVRWLEEYRRFGELAILRLIGLFDRPAPPEAMNALVTATELAPAMGRLQEVGSDEWNHCVDALRDMGLLSHEIPDWPGTLDAHPLVREHFRDLLRGDGGAWEKGNRRLFEYYRQQAPPKPSNSKEMNPLYAAVTHGCAAGQYQEVFDSVLLRRVWRDRRTNFATRHLGMTGSDLVALSNFFQHRRWTKLRNVPLSHRARVLILTNAGVRLRQLGRISDARECFGAVVQEIDPRTSEVEEMEDASYAAAQYCELLVIAGLLSGSDDAALASGKRAVAYADRGHDPYFSMHARSSLAEVHFMLGESDRARTLFEEARGIGRTRRPRPPFLYSQSLFRYGYYLIENGRADELLAGEAADPAWGTNGEDTSLLSSAIRLLILGAACRSLIEHGDRTTGLQVQAQELLDEAVGLFHTAGYPDYTVRGLLERADFYRIRHHSEDYAQAMEDLEKASFEADRGQMELLCTDITLRRLSCYVDFRKMMTNPERSAARKNTDKMLARAAEQVNRIGYRRRGPMLIQLQEKLA